MMPRFFEQAYVAVYEIPWDVPTCLASWFEICEVPARHLSDSLCTGLNLGREMVCTFNVRTSAYVSKLLIHQLALINQVENL
jgi:hypothetical protein